MKDDLRGLVKTSANIIEGTYGRHPARFVYKNQTYELYDLYPTRAKAQAIVNELRERKFSPKIVKLSGYITAKAERYAVYATDLKYPMRG